MDNQIPLFFIKEKDPEELLPEQIIQVAYEWIIANFPAWIDIQRWVLEAHNDNKHTSIDRAVTELREGQQVIATDMFKINNNTRAVLSRYLLRYHPQLEKSKTIKVRKSKIDGYKLPALPITYIVAVDHAKN